MKCLIIYAHPEPTSFTAALKDTAVQALKGAGHSVEVSNLYGEGFNPVAGRHDFTSVADTQRFHYQSEQLHASKTAGFSPDLVREQERLQRADFVIMIFPIWWGGMPAIMKGWFDRVCAYGVAYADGRRFDKGFYLGRRAMLGLSSGGTRERFTDGDAYGDIERVLHPVKRCMLEYLGLEVLEPFVAYAAPRVDDETRKRYLVIWQERLLTAVNDPAWQQRLQTLAEGAATNRTPLEGAAWAAKR